MLKKIWDHFEEEILVYSYLLVVPLLFMQVIMRYCFNNSLTWSEELARYIFIWQVWLGASFCVKENRHIRIDIFTNHLPENVYKVFEFVITLISIAFCVFMVIKGGSVMGMVGRFNQTSPALALPMTVVYACVPISSALMIIHYIENLVKLVKYGRTGKKEEEA